MSSHDTSDQPRLIVGLGASAGGLDEFKVFFDHLPAKSGMAFVVVQHLDPSHESRIADILQRHTDMPVRPITDGVAVAANHVYTLPPDKLVDLDEGRLVLKPREPRPRRRAIDHFFASLAEVARQRAAAIVFSGAGTDGTHGLRAVQGSGGLTIVQDPRQATHGGMPASAERAGVADFVVPTARMPEILLRYAEHPYTASGRARQPVDPEAGAAAEAGIIAVDDEDAPLRRLHALLESREGFDLGLYKTGTVNRRLGRRMGLAGSSSLSDYVDQLRHDPAERRAFVQDILIGVTEFFRDREAFDALRHEVLGRLVTRAARRQKPLRVWVAGCSTGEEAYSLAMLIDEVARDHGESIELQMYATDANARAIGIARRGIFPRSLLRPVSQARRQRYFVDLDDALVQVKTSLRDQLSFAEHDLCGDPPFSRMDLISCRNVLIYFKQEVQRQVLEAFHFSLEPDGALFLGTADGIALAGEAFPPISSQWSIYRRGELERQPGRHWTSAGRRDGPVARSAPRSNETSAEDDDAGVGQLAASALLAAYAPASVLVSEDNEVLYVHGDVSDCLRLPDGQPRLELKKMLRDEVRTQAMAAVYKARREGVGVAVDLPGSDERAPVGLRARPVEAPPLRRNWVLLSFEATASAEAAQPVQDLGVVRQLEMELESTREQLRTTIEELESSNEELRSAHEESLSMNEELQSTNEELEATTEELRSMNEELITLNDQLKDKIDEVQQAHDDLSNFMASTKLATLFLGPDLKIRRLTPAAERLLGVRQLDIGRRLETFDHPLLDDGLADQIRRVLQDLSPLERELEVGGGDRFVRTVLPYRTADDRIGGVVVTYSDITELRAATERLSERERQQAAVARLGWQGLSLESVDVLEDHSVRLVQQTMGVEMCGLFTDDGRGGLELTYGSGWPAGDDQRVRVAGGLDSFVAFARQAPEAIIVQDLSEDARFTVSQALADIGVRSAVGVRVAVGDEPSGVLAVFSTRKREFSADDAHFLMSVAGLLAVARKRAHTEQALRHSERQSRQRLGQLDTVYGTAPVGLAVVDTALDVVKINRRLAALADCEPQDCTGLALVDLLPEGLEVLETHMVSVLESEQPELDIELVGRGVDGQPAAWLCSLVPLRLDDGPVEQLSCVIHDVTERRRHEEALEKAARDLKAASEQKDQFLAMLGHELRNPLAAMRSAVDLQAQMDEADDLLSRTRDVLDRQVRHMKRIVDELLDNSRIAQQKLEVERLPVDLVGLMDEVVGYHRELDPLGLALELDLGDAPRWVDGDAVRLVQVFDNLVSNAIKYTPAGGTIRIAAELDDGYHHVSVVDDGIGIADEILESIFEPFTQGNQPLGRQQGGLGLGLSLVRGIVELHGGRVTAANRQPGPGARFDVWLPVGSPPEHPQPDPAALSVDAADGRRVILVEDNADTRQLLSRALTLHGHEVRTAGDADELWALLDDGLPEAVICDIGLPGGASGYDLARQMRADERCRDLVLIALTGYGSSEARRESAAAGFDHHIVKPADVHELNALLAELERTPRVESGV